MNAPDRTGPRVELYPDPLLVPTPTFPFRVTPASGYFRLNPKVVIGGNGTEVSFIPCRDWEDENFPGYDSGGARDYWAGVCNVLIGEIEGKYHLICPLGYYYHNRPLHYGEDSSKGHCEGVDPLIAGAEYRWVFSAPDVDTFRTTLYRVGQDVAVATWDSWNSADLMDGDPDVRIGYPSAAHLAAYYGADQFYAPPEEFVITGMRGL